MKDKNQNRLPGDFNLDGKVTLITGGGTGLGKAMALAMAQSGANVVISGRRMKPLQEVVGKIKTMGGQAILIQTDVTKSTQENYGYIRTYRCSDKQCRYCKKRQANSNMGHN